MRTPPPDRPRRCYDTDCDAGSIRVAWCMASALLAGAGPTTRQRLNRRASGDPRKGRGCVKIRHPSFSPVDSQGSIVRQPSEFVAEQGMRAGCPALGICCVRNSRCRRDARNERRTAQGYFCCHLSRIARLYGGSQAGSSPMADGCPTRCSQCNCPSCFLDRL